MARNEHKAQENLLQCLFKDRKKGFPYESLSRLQYCEWKLNIVLLGMKKQNGICWSRGVTRIGENAQPDPSLSNSVRNVVPRLRS